MIASTLSQPYILLILSILGAVFGFIYMLNYFISSFLIKSKLFGHFCRIFYTIAYGIAFFCVNLSYFAYNIHIYHYFVCIATTILVSWLIYLPIRKYYSKIAQVCDSFVKKLHTNKFFAKILK